MLILRILHLRCKAGKINTCPDSPSSAPVRTDMQLPRFSVPTGRAFITTATSHNQGDNGYGGRSYENT